MNITLLSLVFQTLADIPPPPMQAPEITGNPWITTAILWVLGACALGLLWLYKRRRDSKSQ